MLDYPDKTACILWFAGCNMRCVYCYNPEIVFGKGKISLEESLNFLQSRKNLLDGVVLSGGECTSHKSIKDLLVEIKKMGFLVKIDTNGSNPVKLRNLIEEKLVDYIALDFKSTEEKFNLITKSDLFNEFNTTLEYLIRKNFPFEVRTTVHSELLAQSDINQMIQILHDKSYSGTYYLQYYRNDSETIGRILNSKQKYLDLKSINKSIVVRIRNES